MQERLGSFRVLFRHNGKQHAFMLGAVDRPEAEAKAAQVDFLVMRFKQRLLALPDGTDIVTFVRHDVDPPAVGPVLPAAPGQVVTLGHLRDRYLAALANGTVDANTLYTCGIHLGHVFRVLGAGSPAGELTVARLQDNVDCRARRVSTAIIRTELATLRAVWNWGGPMSLTDGRFPRTGLRFPKVDEEPDYLTREVRERRLLAGGDPEARGPG